jgi:multicomponent Na+:H+ antiporter subunit D
MNEHLIILPIIIQALLAVLMLFLWRIPKVQRTTSIIGSGIAIVIAAILFTKVWTDGTLVIQLGNWEAPYGISLVGDLFAATLIMLTAIVGFVISIYSNTNMVAARIKFGYYAIFHFLIMGLSGAFLTGDIFNLYVWFEVIIISSFVLLTIGGRKIQIEGAVKYFTLNMLSSIVFLTGIAMLYGVTGSLNMAELAKIIPTVENKGIIQTISIVFFIGFGVKAGVFPLYLWLPASYHTPPAAVSALFGGLLTKVGVYALIRIFTLLFPLQGVMQDLFMIIAGLTVFFGGIGALVQKDVLRVFSYLIICHIGFMIGGLSLFTELALIGAVFYMFHDIIVKTSLFMIGGVLFRIFGNTKMYNIGGLMNNYPRLSVLFAIPLFALIGIPPLSGFWPKLSLFGAAFETDSLFMLIVFIFASLITLIIIVKLWNNVFAKNAREKEELTKLTYYDEFSLKEKSTMIVPILFLVVMILYFSFFAEHIQVIAERISFEIMHPQQYIDKVLSIKNEME